MAKQTKRVNKVRNTLEIIVILFLICGSIAGMYLSDGYKASEQATQMVDQPVTVLETTSISYLSGDNYFAYVPDSPEAGFLFYPGGLVDHKAYAPLMLELAKQDILAVTVSMPCDLAVLDKNAAKDILEDISLRYDQVDWYMGGHSLGGVMAAAYAADHADSLKGLVFLASYTTEDISKSGLKVLSLLGSEDGVLNQEKYEENKKNLPSDYIEYLIEGGCHAGFGDYGAQEGDNTPSISSEEQIRITAEQISDWMDR